MNGIQFAELANFSPPKFCAIWYLMNVLLEYIMNDFKRVHISVLVRSYGAPSGARRHSVVQCYDKMYDKTRATLAQSKISWHC